MGKGGAVGGGASAAAHHAATNAGMPDIESDDEDEIEEIDLILPYQDKVKEWYAMFWVQIAIALLIVANFVVSGISKQVNQASDKPAFVVFELFFNICFTVELVANMYANFFQHFWIGPERYWNMFDFAIVLISLLAMTMDGVPGISVLRLFRAFRVFRLFKRVESLRLIIEGVLASLPGVINAFVVLFIFMGIWSIMGVEFFSELDSESSLRRSCELAANNQATPSYGGVSYCRSICDDNYGMATEKFSRFSNAMFTMFEMLSLDSWCSGTTHTLVFYYQYPLAAFWSISYVFITAIVLTNVVVAILLEKYLSCVQGQEEKQRRRKARKKAQLEWERKMIAAEGKKNGTTLPMQFKAPVPSAPKCACKLRKLPYQNQLKEMYESNSIQILVAVLILVNFLLAAANAQVKPQGKNFGDSPEFDFFYIVEWFFANAFGLELIVNMYASFFWEFWTGENATWNQFDFVIVVISYLSLLLDGVPGISVLRLFRAFRVMRLFKRIESLRVIIEAVLMCMPKVAQAFAVLGILMGVWSIMGVEFFYLAAPDQFGSFIKAFLTMWQVLTGDSWSSGSGMARELIFGTYTKCAPCDDTCTDAPGKAFPMAAIFFVTYIFCAAIIMNNVVIAILLEGYLKCTTQLKEEKDQREQNAREKQKKEEAEGMVTVDERDMVQLTSLDYDMKAIMDILDDDLSTKTLHASDIRDIVKRLIGKTEVKEVMQAILRRLKAESDNGGESKSVLLGILNERKKSSESS